MKHFTLGVFVGAVIGMAALVAAISITMPMKCFRAPGGKGGVGAAGYGSGGDGGDAIVCSSLLAIGGAGGGGAGINFK